MSALLRQIDRVVDRRALARALLALAPLTTAAFATGDALWMPAALVTAASFIAMEQAGPPAARRNLVALNWNNL